MYTRKIRDDPLVRAALRLHRALSAGAGRRGECGMDATRLTGWVMDAVPALEQCRRRLALARGRGWSLAAGRLEEQLGYHLRCLGRQLQAAASGPPPSPHRDLPPVSTLIDELRQLHQEFGSVELRHDEERGGTVVAAKTDPITLEGVYLGDFSLRLGVGRLAAGRTDSACFRVVALDPHPASCSESTTHPHVRDESLCAGEAAAIGAALREGRVCDAFLLVRSVLGTYNASSPYVPLEQWEGGECSDCGGGFGRDELYGCGHCGGEFCGECSGACEVCGDVCCLGCRREAGEEWLCPDCAGACRRCGYTTRQVELDEGDGLCGDCLQKQEQSDEEPPAEEPPAEEPPAEEAQAAGEEGAGTDRSVAMRGEGTTYVNQHRRADMDVTQGAGERTKGDGLNSSAPATADRPQGRGRRPWRWDRPTRPRLVFSPLAWLKLMLLTYAGETEVGGFGVSSERDPLYVQDLVTVRQHVTVVGVRFEDDAVADHFDRMADRGVGPARCGRLWVHTHPGDSPTPSAVDEETFARAFGDADWAVMAVVARGGRSYARLSFSAGPGGAVRLPVSVDWAAWPGVLAEHAAGTQTLTELTRAWAEEYTANVHPEPLTWGPGLMPADAPGLLALEEDELAGFGGWDYLDLQQAYALQDMQEEYRRRLNTCRGAAEGAYE